MNRKNKYNARITEIDGYKFHSRKEGQYYCKLKLLQKAGEIKYFLRQIPFHLSPEVIYRCDFMVVDKNDKVEFIEVKGFMTDSARLKIEMTKDIYKVDITIV